MSLFLAAVNVTRAQFDGTLMGHSSYLSLLPPPFIRDHFELKFNFVTDDARQVALLLFIGQQVDSEEKDFLAVSFIRGHVALTWDLGSGTRRIFTARPVAVSTMGGHSVHVGRRGRVAWLQVNNQPTVTGRSPGLMSILNAHPQLFIGFFQDFISYLQLEMFIGYIVNNSIRRTFFLQSFPTAIRFTSTFRIPWLYLRPGIPLPRPRFQQPLDTERRSGPRCSTMFHSVLSTADAGQRHLAQ